MASSPISSSSSCSSISPPFSESRASLQYFQQAQRRWQSSPRKKRSPIIVPPPSFPSTEDDAAAVITKQPPLVGNGVIHTRALKEPKLPLPDSSSVIRAALRSSGKMTSNLETTDSRQQQQRSSSSNFANQCSASDPETRAAPNDSLSTTSSTVAPSILFSTPPRNERVSAFGSPGSTVVRGDKALLGAELSVDHDSINNNSDNDSTHRDRLVAFYQEYNPSKLDTVDATLAKFRGKEEELFDKLEKRYNPSGIPPATGDGPTCFLEFTLGGHHQSCRVQVKLFSDKTPLAAENFRALCTGETTMTTVDSTGQQQQQSPLSFRNCPMHRIVPNFVIQGGDVTKGDGTGGKSIYPPSSKHGDMWGKFKDERFLQHNRKGLLSMANNGANRNGSQFFITLAPLPSLNGKHVVFGEVVEGMEFVERISRLPTDAKQRPLERVVISDCGEIRDGKEIRASNAANESSSGDDVPKPAPFGFSTSTSKPTKFGSVSPLQSPLSPSNTMGSPFSLSTSSPRPFLFGGSAATIPFSFAQLATEAQQSTSDATVDKSITAFGGSAFTFTNQGSTLPFSFLSPAAAAATSSDTAKTRSDSIDDSTDSGESSVSSRGDSTDSEDEGQDDEAPEETQPFNLIASSINGLSTVLASSSSFREPSFGATADDQTERANPFNFAACSIQSKPDPETIQSDT